MSKPRASCSFCGSSQNPLSKGHIWPDSFGEILPSDAEHYEQKVGWFNTFESKIPSPDKFERVGTGPLQKRRPRNTCIKCNSGWMSRLESAALPIVKPLILAEPTSLDTASMSMLAAVPVRIELTSKPTRTIPQDDIQFLMNNGRPSDNWRIWIAQHSGNDLKGYGYSYAAMQILSKPTAIYGPELCNTHVTTLIAGQLYAHVLFSTVWPDFPGYEGISLTKVWPANEFHIKTECLPAMSERDGIELHEAIARLGTPGAL